jgi:hypothetical protein
MNADLQAAKVEENLEVPTFNLQKALPLPRIPTNTVYYKRQLMFYNLGIHSGAETIPSSYNSVTYFVKFLISLVLTSQVL